MGSATSRPGERLEAVVKRADLAMFEEKRAYHAGDTNAPAHASSAA
jgi:hypothetical protein